MNNSPHWAQDTPHGHLVIDGTGYLVADCARPEDARRIVACVNACEEISTEQLEVWVCMSRPILQSLKELKAEADREAKQRDELLEAAIEAERVIEILWASHHANRADAALDALRAAIAKATGDQP